MDEKDTTEARILAFLQHHPKGAAISEIATKIQMNRNTTTKFLALLEAQGKVESATYGTAHVYRSAHRAPLGALLDQTSAMIATIDRRDRIVFANEPFLRYFGLTQEGCASRVPDAVCPDVPLDPPFATLFDGREGSEGNVRIQPVRAGPRKAHLKIRWIPTVMEDRMYSTTFIIEDITDAQDHLHNMEFLARTAGALADMGDEEDIFQYIADRISELVPDCIVVVNAMDMEQNRAVLAGVSGEPRLVAEYEALCQGVWDRNTVQSLDGAPEAIPFQRQGVLL
ncbi:MAG: PAS domain-containing protein, partial [Methanomicrobiales archaeon]|nr:PAS domain-containing protein [Methanomicrobiales archaeon]